MSTVGRMRGGGRPAQEQGLLLQTAGSAAPAGTGDHAPDSSSFWGSWGCNDARPAI